jgi:hypothetical protein
MHPILAALDQTPHEWIKKLLFTFNEGNIGKFEALAPLFPKEVSSFLSFLFHNDQCAWLHIADPPRKLCVPPSKDLLNGVDRVSVQAKRR